MLRKYYAVIGPAHRVMDAVILTLSWFVAYYLRKHFPLAIMQTELHPFRQFKAYAIVIVLLWGAVFSVANLYSSKRMTRRTIEAYKVWRSHTIACLIFIALTYLVSAYKLSRGVFVYFYFISGALLIFSRVFIRNWLREMRARGQNIQRVVLIGTRQPAINCYNKFSRHPELGLEFIGFIGENPEIALPKSYLGGLDKLPQILASHNVDKVVVAFSRSEAGSIELVLNELKDEVIDVILVPDIYEYVSLGCEVEDFDGVPMVSLNETPIVGINLLSKRISDVVISSLAVILLSPLMLLLAILVKVTSRGPIFYTQERMSINGKKFMMLKFRSMTIDQKGDVELLTKENDPRVTKIGSIMRRTSLDELPQFFNVLIGDMSIVGPRPERTWVVDQVRTQIPRYMLKHKVKAGITGWAQVNGWRGDTSLEKRIEHDLYYIKNWSFLFDMKILFLTIFKGLINRNAY